MPTKKAATSVRPARPGATYERLTGTQRGRDWLGLNPEAHIAYGLAMDLLALADEICATTLPEERRRELAHEIQRVHRAYLDFDATRLEETRKRMVDALDYAAKYRRAVKGASTKRQVEEASAFLAVYGLVCEDQGTLRRAVELWPTKKPGNGKWRAVHALARALRCDGDASVDSLCAELKKLREK